MSVPDSPVAAIAKSRGLSVAARNTRDFEDCGVELLNPFELEYKHRIPPGNSVVSASTSPCGTITEVSHALFLNVLLSYPRWR